MFGTAKDSSNVLLLKGIINSRDNKIYLSVNGVEKEVIGYVTPTYISLNTQQYTNSSYLTVYVKDKSSLLTDRLYFTIKNGVE